MVKAKKKKNLSDFAQQKRAQKDVKQLNPFEVQINRDKQNVLGRRKNNDRGLPGVSRAKAINKRKQTLLQEYKLKNKDNVFLDKRIGERDSTMSVDDKAMARFTMERMKMHKKKSIFNLNDDEVLTHRGQTLEEIEKFDDPKSDDDFSDDENTSGKLDRHFVEEAHFGGGVLSKPDSALSRKDLIDQLIAESKKRKAEKQKIREQTIDLTEKLDSEWKDLLPIMSASKKLMEDATETKDAKADAYDIAVRQLIFEARGNPTEKLKSEEEIVQEEKERLEALEADRVARMKGFVSDTNNQFKHKSADDLDDGFMLETVVDDNDDNNDDKNSVDNDDDNSGDNDANDSNEEDSDNNEANDDDINDEQTSIKSESIAEKKINTRKDNSEDQESICSESSKVEIESEIDVDNKNLKIGNELDEEESEDSLLDLKVSDSSSEDEENKTIKKHVKFADNLTKGKTHMNQLDSPKSILKQNNSSTDVQNLSDKDRKKEIRNDLLKRKEIMEKARKELPYTYNAPESFEELEKLLKHHNADYQSVIVDRIIKCNHWTLNGKNKEKMLNLFAYLLQHINNCASAMKNADDLVKCFQIFDRLCPYLYDLAHLSPENTKTYVKEVLEEKYEKFAKNKKRYPGVDTLILFKLVSLLFPTSDFRHPIVTPCLVFMSEILLRAHIKKYRSDISKGLFISTLILEYTVLSKRFAPSVINFLRGIIYTATESTEKVKIIPPFKAVCKVLVIDNIEITIDPNGANMFASDLVYDELDDEFRIKALLTAINLVIEFKNQLQELEAAYSIFEPIYKLLKINKFKKYPQNVRSHIKQLRKDLKLLQSKKLNYIVFEKKRPKPLRTYEPKIMTVYDGKHHRPMSKEKAEREKLLHKYKREFKGAVREIRRDREFLSKVQIAQQIMSDAERKRKVNEIFSEAATQQHEFKKMKKKK